VLAGEAPESLIDSYQAERHAAAVENLTVCRRTARFLAPRSKAEHRLRQAVCTLAKRHEFARRLANTGRMAQANAYPPSPWVREGSRSVQNVAFDGTNLMRCLGGETRFLGLAVGADALTLATLDELAALFPIDFRRIEPAGPLAAHLGAAAGAVVIVRPDAYVAATLPDATPDAVAAAMRDALGVDERERLAAAA
jgi:3-(3-hydroxy-phenyl)propionate hydroxylase